MAVISTILISISHSRASPHVSENPQNIQQT